MIRCLCGSLSHQNWRRTPPSRWSAKPATPTTPGTRSSRSSPDVMTLDIQMPGLDGIEFLRKLMPPVSPPRGGGQRGQRARVRRDERRRRGFHHQIGDEERPRQAELYLRTHRQAQDRLHRQGGPAQAQPPAGYHRKPSGRTGQRKRDHRHRGIHGGVPRRCILS